MTDNNSKFSYHPVNTDTISELISKQKSYSAGLDGVSGKMLQIALPWILHPLTHIINYSFELSQIPSQWKCALVKPIPKKGAPTCLKDLRPISLLSTLLKIAESALLQQLNIFISQANILPTVQSGFRTHFSTTTVLSSLIDDVLKGCCDSKVTSLTLLDMSKAFDAVNFKLLLAKLKYYGLSENCVTWLENYLLNRSQVVSCHGSISKPLTIKSGVPQGSVLGPVLFSIYTADFPKYLQHCQLHMYADDFQIYYSFNPVSEHNAPEKINSDLERSREWTCKNCLSLNLAKTISITLGTPNKIRAINSDLNLHIGGTTISSARVVKSLGLHIDNQLKFTDHINKICQTTFNGFKLISPYKNLLDIRSKRLLTDALILSHLNYADIVYGPCLSCVDKYRLQKIQNFCVRYIYSIPRDTHITPFVRNLGWMKMHERRFHHFIKLITKIRLHNEPHYLQNKISIRSSVHDRNLRQIDLTVDIPSHSLSSYKSSFSYLAAYVINNVLRHYSNLNNHYIIKSVKDLLLAEQAEIKLRYVRLLRNCKITIMPPHKNASVSNLSAFH